MKNEEIIQHVKKNVRTHKHHDLFDLFWAMEKHIQGFIPIVRHGKEATDEYNDYPTPENQVIMEMSRSNVALFAQKLADKLSELYDKLSISSKRVLSPKEFSAMVQERLTNLLGQEEQ